MNGSLDLSFRRTFAGNICLVRLKEVIAECELYEVKQRDELVSRLFFGDEHAVIETPGQLIRIDRYRGFSTRYKIVDHLTDQPMGSLEDPSWFIRGQRFIISLNNTGSFVVRRNGRRRDHQHSIERMDNGETAVLSGRIYSTGRRFFARKKDMIFEGRINSPASFTPLVIPLALYAIEERFRTDRENAG